MTISPSWSHKLSGILLLELLILASTGCGSWLAFTPERAAVEALLEPPDIFGPPINITEDSVKVAQVQEWQDGFMVAVAFNATELQDGPVDCLFIYEVISKESRWSANAQSRSCWPVGGSGEPYERSESQLSGTDILGMSNVYGLVYDDRVAALDILWEDGERGTADVINGTYFWARAGVHETVQVRPLDENGELLK